MAQICKQIDYTCVRKAIYRHWIAEAFQWGAGFSIECCEEKSRRDNVDDVLAIDLTEAYALAVIGTHRILITLRIWLSVGPDCFAGLRVNCNDVATRARYRIHSTVNVARCGATALRLEAGPVPLPRYF